MKDEAKYRQARHRVKELKGFYSHLIVYLAVNLLLLVINLVVSPFTLWFYWVTIFWGLGLVIHAANTFIIEGKVLGKEWEEKKIKEYMRREEEE